MKKKKKILEGRAKKLYETEETDQLVQEFKDDVITFEGFKKGTIKGKGVTNNQISSYLFEYLAGFHIVTHFIKNLSSRDMLVKQLDMIPIEIIIRNIATGSFCKRYGLEKGNELDYPITEYFLKDDTNRNPMINATHAISFGYAKIDEIRTIERLSSKINAVLKSFFARRKLRLVDFKLEFGRYKNKILLGDEISPDTCRLWDAQTKERLDNGSFLSDESEIETVYEELKNRILQN